MSYELSNRGLKWGLDEVDQAKVVVNFANAEARSILNKVQDRVSIEDFYKVGDSDYSSAFNKGIEYLSGLGGGVLNLRPGKTYTAANILPRHNVTIHGNGSTIQLKAGATASDFLFDGNVARGMLDEYSYDIPASSTVGTNIGTFTP